MLYDRNESLTLAEQVKHLLDYTCGSTIAIRVREMYQRYCDSHADDTEVIPIEQFACETGDRYMPFWFKTGDIVSPAVPGTGWKYGVVVDVVDNVANRLGTVEIRTDDGELRRPYWYELTRSSLPKEILDLAKTLVTPECPIAKGCPLLSAGQS